MVFIKIGVIFVICGLLVLMASCVATLLSNSRYTAYAAVSGVLIAALGLVIMLLRYVI